MYENHDLVKWTLDLVVMLVCIIICVRIQNCATYFFCVWHSLARGNCNQLFENTSFETRRFKSRQFGERRGQAHEPGVVWLRQSVFCHHWGLLLPGSWGLFNFLNILLITFIALFMFKVIVVFKQVGNKFGTREPQAKSCAYKCR